MQGSVGNLKVRFCKAKYELKIHYQSFSFTQRANVKRYIRLRRILSKSDFAIFEIVLI